MGMNIDSNKSARGVATRTAFHVCMVALSLVFVSCADFRPRHAPSSPVKPVAAAPSSLLATPPPVEVLEPLQARFRSLAMLHRMEKEGPARAPEKLRVAVISDLNGSYGSKHYRREVHRSITWIRDELKPDLVLSTGDMVAGMKAGLDYEGMWVAFHAAVTLPLTRAGIPFAPTPGNHDATSRPGYEEERAEYKKQWKLWRPALDYVDVRHYPRRYAFMERDVLFVSIDATSVGRISEAQFAWLDDVLTRHENVPVKIVYGHLPIYPFAQHRDREVLGDRALEALLNEHGVTAYLSGHHHAYYPGKRGDLRMVSLSCLGGGARKLLWTDAPSPRSVLVLEIDPVKGITSLEAHPVEDFERPIARRSLPESVGQDGTEIIRDDISP
jgi:3',5'-cyclic AMP phosphodiesterase CpdA